MTAPRAHQNLVALGERQLAHDDRHVERAGHAQDLYLLVGGTVAPERIESAPEQRLDDELVEPRHHDADAQIARAQLAFDYFERVNGHDSILASLSIEPDEAGPLTRSRPRIP
jgi:hypothetical protein